MARKKAAVITQRERIEYDSMGRWAWMDTLENGKFMHTWLTNLDELTELEAERQRAANYPGDWASKPQSSDPARPTYAESIQRRAWYLNRSLEATNTLETARPGLYYTYIRAAQYLGMTFDTAAEIVTRHSLKHLGVDPYRFVNTLPIELVEGVKTCEHCQAEARERVA